MEFRERIEAIALSRYFPLKFVVSDFMMPNILLMNKLMFILLLVHGFIKSINDPYIPFFGFFDEFLKYPGVFKIINRGLFIAAGAFLIFNIKVRLMCLILGAVVFLTQFASIPEFANHYFICGCVFLLSGLINKKNIQLFFAIQLSLVYFGASINKMFKLDWWNGDFMFNWLVNARENTIFIFLSEAFPEMWLAKLFSWSSILIEFSIAFLILNKNTRNIAVWILIIFHSLLYTLTAFRFGHFYEDLLITLLAFVNFPKEKIKINFDKGILNSLMYMFNFPDLKKLFFWTNEPIKGQYWLKLVIGKNIKYNLNALRYLLLHTLNFYVFLFFLDLAIRVLFNGILMDIIHISLTWLGVFFFLPILWNHINKEVNV